MELYKQLFDLTKEDNSPFYYSDHRHNDGFIYRIFLYRLSSYSEFKKPSAIESRGIMFRLEETPVLVSRPFEKFFNYHEIPDNERPSTEDVIQLDEKFDGSLIRTFYDANGNLNFASKGSLTSEHAAAANRIFDSWDNNSKTIVKHFATEYTMLFEYCSPEHQIVIKYPEPKLKLIGIRHTLDGTYFKLKPLNSVYENIPEVMAGLYDSPVSNFEGYVGIDKTGRRFKLKTKKYLELHKLKDDINNTSRLIDCILNEKSDDLVNAFSEYPEIIESVRKMESLVIPRYRKFITEIEEFYSAVQHQEKRTAVEMLKAKCPELFHAVISRYNGKKFDDKKLFKLLHEDEILKL